MLKFFHDNPDEELTTADICKKFSVKRGQVWDSLSGHKRNGVFDTRIDVVKGSCGRRVKMVVWSRRTG
jgi:hypothetical protein